MQPAGRNHIARKLQLVVGGSVALSERVAHNAGPAIRIEATGEVAPAFERRGHRYRAGAIFDKLALKLLAPKEKKLRAIAIPLAGKIHRPIDRVVTDVIAIGLTLDAALIVEEAIGRVTFVPVEVAGAAVELLAAAARDDRNRAAGVAPILCGVVRKQYFHLAHGIHGRHGMDAAIRAGVQRSDAVDTDVLGIVAAAGKEEPSHTAGSRLPALARIHHSRQ